jgi:hypothetical protein
MGSSNGTKVHVPNTADFKARQRALQEAWGGSKKWALTYDVAKDLRPSVMREMPTDEESAAQPETIYLHSPNTNTEVNYRASERFPLQSRRSTREMFGLDAATMAVVNLAPTTGAMHAERFSILDRGDIPYGEEYSLFEGGPLLGSHERYVLADKGFMTAANEAQRREDPSYLRRYAEQHGGLRVVNSRQSTHVMAGRANWRYVFGEEAAERVDRNKTVSAGHMGMSFGTGHESEVLIVDGGSTNGTEVIVGPRRSEAIASVMGASAIGGEPTKVYEGRHARQEA